MPNTPSNIDEAAIWAAAIEGLEIQKKRIEDQIAAVKSLLGGAAAPAAESRRRGRPPGSKNVAAAPAAGPKKRGPKPGRKKRTLSPEARARIAEAQKKRWAEHNKKKAAK
jgi:hypothetical protein